MCMSVLSSRGQVQGRKKGSSMEHTQEPVEQIDQNKLYLMIRLARYEQRNRDRTLRIHKCFRSDYIGYALLSNLLLTTIGYILLLAVVALIKLETILSNFNNMNYAPIIAVAVVGYLVVLGIYSVITYTIASLRFSRVESSVEQYEKQLARLEDVYRDSARKRRAERNRQGRRRR